MNKHKKEDPMRIIEFGVPNRNGRVYTKDSFKSIPSDVPLLREMPEGGAPPSMKDRVGMAHLEVGDDGVYLKILLHHVEHVDQGEFPVRSFGVGRLKENGEVYDYDLQGVAFVRDPA